MNVYVTKMNGLYPDNLSQYKQQMIVRIAHQLGCREMGIYCYDGRNESADSLYGRLDGIIAGIQWGEDVVICQFPTGNGAKFEWELVKRIRFYQCRVVILIHDVEHIVSESNRASLPETIRLYNQAEVLIVPSLMLRQFLLDHGIRKDMKFVIQEMLDYMLDIRFTSIPQFRKEIHFTGKGEFEGMGNWAHDVRLKLYEVPENHGRNVNNMGKLRPEELIFTLSKGGFGLVWYQDEVSRQEMEYGLSLELSRYLAVGIPAIVPIGISNQILIEKNHLGLAVNSLDEAAAAIEAMTKSEYQEYVQCVGQFAQILKNGYYTKICLADAIQSVFRKDAGEISTPPKIYDLGEASFIFTVLKESYGGNLALSWKYQGKADGFLIYDTSGKLVHESRNEHQHYFLIQGYEKQKGFFIKAYVETLTGKLIVAKSVSVFLEEEKDVLARVSLIIPAYNAEDYIVRSIDTALAQSFFDLEIIIVDDESTDHTPSILDWYAEKYSNVRVIYQKNAGPAVARNRGIKAAEGEYIGFLDSDDMICTDMISRLYDSAKANNCDIAITSVYKIEDDGYKVIMAYQLEENVAIAVEDFFQVYFHTDISMVAVWNKLYRTVFIKERLLPELTLGEDGAWTPYILSYAENICYLNDLSYEYDRVVCKNPLMHKWGGNQTKEERFLIHKEMVTFYLKHGNPKRINFLKVMAKWSLIGWQNTYAYDEYEKLREQIEETF